MATPVTLPGVWTKMFSPMPDWGTPKSQLAALFQSPSPGLVIQFRSARTVAGSVRNAAIPTVRMRGCFMGRGDDVRAARSRRAADDADRAAFHRGGNPFLSSGIARACGAKGGHVHCDAMIRQVVVLGGGSAGLLAA